MQTFTNGRQLKAARTLANITQKTLAAECGIHEKTLEYWEARRDARGMHGEYKRRVTEALFRRGVIFIAQPWPGACLNPSQDRTEFEPTAPIDLTRGMVSRRAG